MRSELVNRYLQLLLVYATVCINHSVCAQTWDGGGINNDWSTADNWALNAAPANDGTASLIFAGVIRLSPSVDTAWSVLGLSFGPSAGAFTLGGSAITIGTGGIVSSSAAVQTVNTALVLAGNQSWTTSAGSMTFGGGLDLGTFALTASPSTGRTLSLNGIISGTGSLVKTGAGALVLAGVNTFSGGSTLTAGTTNVGNNAAFGTGTIALNGGTISATGAARTIGNAVSVTANSTIGGALALTLSGGVTLTGNRTVTVSNSALTTFGGALGESGGTRNFTKAGAGNLQLDSASTYTGTTSITGGALALGNSGTISGANLVLNGGVLALGSNFTRALGTGAGQVQFGAAGGGFAALGGPVSVTGFTGTPTWGTTAQFLPTGGALLLNSTLGNNVVTWTTGFSLGTASRTITVADNLLSAADYADISGIVSSGLGGGINKTGVGRLDLSGLNTYTGQTVIGVGRVTANTLLDAGIASSLGAPTGASATILLGATTNTGTLVYTGTTATTDRLIRLSGTTGGGVIQADGTGALTLSGTISGTAAGAKILTFTGSNTGANQATGVIADGASLVAVAKTGTGSWELSGANTYTAGTTLSAGTLNAGSNTAFGTGSLGLAGGTLQGSGGSRTLSNAGLLSASSSIGGTSDLLLNGAFSQSGGNQTLTITNSGITSFNGTLSLADSNQARVLTIANTGTVNLNGVVQNGTGTGADALTKTGLGTLTLANANTFTGALTLSGGTTRATGGLASLGAGTLTLGGGNLTLVDDTALNYGRNTTLSGSSTITQERTTAGAGVTHTFGTLSAGTATLALSAGPNVLSGTAILFYGATSLTGNLTTAIGPSAQLTLGPLTSTAARILTKTNTGTLLLGSTSGTLITGSSLVVNNGTVRLGATNALGSSGLFNVTLNANSSGANALFDLNGFNQSVLGLTFGGTGATATSTNQITTGAASLSLNGNVTSLNTGNPLSSFISGNLNLGNVTRTFTIGDSLSTVNELEITAVVSGSGGVTKTGTGTLTLSSANAYTGKTTVSAGILSVNSLANVSFTSALGAPISIANGTIDLGATTATATLFYTGATTATDRVINLSGTTGGAVLNASGTGALTLNSPLTATGAGSKTLTLTGTNADENTINGAIVNNSATNTTSVAKTGTGTWALKGANTYTGATTVSSGSLIAANNSALGTGAGATTVASGATLALMGSITTNEVISIAGIGAGGNGALRNLSGNNTITTSLAQSQASRIISEAGTLTIDPASGNAVTGAFALTVGGAGNVLFNDPLATASGFTKTGSGRVTFAGTGNSLGAVAVSAGTLALIGNLTGGTVSVSAGATLTGQGTVAGATTISGNHAPGSGIGSQSFSNGLTYNTGSLLQWELSGNTTAAPGTNFDQVLLTGGNLVVNSGSNAGLSFDGAGSTVDWNDAFWGSARSWTVLAKSGAGSSTGTFAVSMISLDSLGQSLASARAGASFTMTNAAGNLALNYAPIPEPTTVALIVAAGLFLIWRTRRVA